MTQLAASLYDTTTGENLLSCVEAADYLNYHPASVRRLACEGTLKPEKRAGNALLFQRAALDRFKKTSAWAARKSALNMPESPPPELPPSLEASISLDLGFGAVFRETLAPIKNFTWSQLPILKAEIDSKYGNLPFDVEVKSPDGGIWSVAYEPPTWLERVFKKITDRKR